MGRRNYVQELEYENAEGLDTTSPVSMLAPGFVRQALNANLGTTGGYSKRDGCVGQLTSVWTGMAIRNGVEFRLLDGTTQTLLFGTDDVTEGKLGLVSGGGIIPVVSGLAPASRLAFAQVEERLYAFNGDSVNTPFVYDGLAVRNLGIAAPLAVPVAVAGTSGNLEQAPYILAYTYAIRDTTNQRIIAESSPSDLVSITLTGVEDSISLDVVASLATVAGNLEIIIRVYRTVGNGSILFLDSTYGNTTTTLSIELPDSGLSTQQIEFDNSLLDSFEGYTKAKFPIIARNRLFVAHNTRNEVRFSKISVNGPLLESFPALNLSSVEGIHGASDKIVGLAQLNGVPIVLKERSIGRLEEIGLPEITQAEDLVTYLYREISQTIGAISHFTSVQVRDELIFLGKDNIYATNGQTVRAIAPLLQSTIRGLDSRVAKINKISMTNDTKYQRIYIQVFENQTAAEPTFTIVGDYQQYPKFRWTFYAPGTNSITHPGFRAGCFFQIGNLVDGSLETYFGNSNNDGDYYKMNSGTSDDDAGTERGIYFKLVSRPYTMGQPMVVKLYKNVRIFAEASDDTYSLEFCSIFDLSVEEEFCQSFSIPGIGNKWDEHNWVDDAETEADPLIWAGPSLAELTYDPHRKAKFMQLVFNQTEADAPVTLLGWGVSGSIFSGL